MKTRVVITGLGVIAPNGIGIGAFEQALRAGKSGLSFQPRLEKMGFRCHVAGVPPNCEALEAKYFTDNQLLSMNSGIKFGCLAALEAWQDAGFQIPEKGSDEVDWDSGVLVGIGAGNLDTISELVPKINSGMVRKLGSRSVEKNMVSSISAKIGGLLALGNRVSTVSSACCSGLEAIIEAAFRIRHQKARRMLAGGGEGVSHYTWAGFDALRVLNSRSNNCPEQASRPMSATAAGFIPGGGAGIIVLESLESALERGARIYAEFIGGEVNSGGQRMGGSITAPNPSGVIQCIQNALADGGVQGEEIDVINGHLTATYADSLEIRNWQSGLKLAPEDFPLINSTKSMIGHALGAAGGIEMIASILQINKGFVHGSINCEDLNEALQSTAKSIIHKTRAFDIKLLAKANFGFGDVNGCAILKKWEN